MDKSPRPTEMPMTRVMPTYFLQQVQLRSGDPPGGRRATAGRGRTIPVGALFDDK